MKTVFVGLSGGVDSAVSAYLLKKEGYRVVGVFLKAWEPDFLPCTGARDRLEAMRVAAHLGIPFMTYDLGEEYKREVVDYFIDEYRHGRTPNPDVLCNRTIKFGAFWREAKKDGADMIATGHYAQNKLKAESWQLEASRDSEKDQTYFLWTLTQDDLSHSLFPVGGYEKSDVRRLAREAGLPNAERKDSQGLCFLGHVDMEAFLKRYLPVKKGNVVDETGAIIGGHDGVWFYTLGQRHGFSRAHEKRLYVVGKDSKKNELTVSENGTADNGATHFTLADMNWISGHPEKGSITARFRYRGERVPISILGNIAVFDTPQLVAPGQSLVFYAQASEGNTGHRMSSVSERTTSESSAYDEEGKQCLGGGIIAG